MLACQPPAFFLALFIMPEQALYSQEQPAYEGEYEEHYKESGYTIRHVLRVHAPGARIPLPDLDSERDHQHQREHIEERDDHLVIVFCQKLEQRIEYEYSYHPQYAYNYEMKLLVVEVPASTVIDAEYLIVYLRDPVNCPVYPFSHLIRNLLSDLRIPGILPGPPH